MTINKSAILRRHGVTLIASAALMVWTVSTCMITGTIVQHNTELEVTERVTAELRANFDQYLADQAEEAGRARFLSGEASKQTAINTDAIALAKIGQGVLNTYGGADLDDARKVMLCAVCRVYSGGEFAKIKSITEAVQQPDQWWGYADDLRYTEDVHKVAQEVSGIYHNAEPMPCSSDLVYAGWNGTKIVLRDKWEDNSLAEHY